MEYDVRFMVEKKDFAISSMAPIFESYEWWIDLATIALKDANEFEMRLWEDDIEGIQSGQKFGENIPNTITKEIVYRGKVGDELKEEILTNFLTKDGYIKWFTLILNKDGKHIFSSEHYGDETYITVNSKEQAAFLQKWAKNFPIIWRVDVFERTYT